MQAEQGFWAVLLGFISERNKPYKVLVNTDIWKALYFIRTTAILTLFVLTTCLLLVNIFFYLLLFWIMLNLTFSKVYKYWIKKTVCYESIKMLKLHFLVCSY